MNYKKARETYIEQDYNCAETTLRLANDRFAFGLTDEEMRMIGGFGGGMGCEGVCGILSAGIVAISKRMISQRAHATEGLKEACAEFVALFEKEMGSTKCSDLKGKYFVEEQRCLTTVELGAKLIESYLEKLPERLRRPASAD